MTEMPVTGTECTPVSWRAASSAATSAASRRPWSPGTGTSESPLPITVGAAHSSRTMWASSWHSTPPQTGLVAASASAFAAVPVATQWTPTGLSNTSAKDSSIAADVASSP
ncbi:MAG: hypothetical protein R2716_08210 [Microthrixaceae bacterium]